MNSYYLHNGTESSGPFNLSELKAKSIQKTTAVWCEGMQDWKTAGDVPELRYLFRIAPPSFETPIPFSEQTKEAEDTTIAEVNKTLFFVLSGVILLIIGTLIFTFFEEKRSTELKDKNSITERNNMQFQLQEKEIEKQKAHIIEQEKREVERVLREKKQTLNNRLLAIKEKLGIDYSNLDQAKKKLTNAIEFQFLRTSGEKSDEISILENEIEDLNIEIENCKKEMDQLYLEIEKMNL